MVEEEEEWSAEDKVDDNEEKRMTYDNDEFGIENERVVHVCAQYFHTSMKM